MTGAPRKEHEDGRASHSFWTCRCPECREALNAYRRDWAHRTGRHKPWAVHVAEVRERSPHGTYNRYQNQRCRCDACRQANTDYTRAREHRTGRHKPRAVYVAEVKAAAEINHGLARYRRGCRCAVCREASRAYKADYRARLRSAA